MPKPVPEFVRHAVETICATAPVTARAMFGGWGLRHGDLSVALIANDTLYFKVDAITQATFAAAGSQPFTYDAKGKPVAMSYWRVPDDALESPALMRPWVELAIAAAKRARS
jgi:DNA transformation protein and related proteins